MPKKNYFKIFKTKKYLGFGVGSGFFIQQKPKQKHFQFFDAIRETTINKNNKNIENRALTCNRIIKNINNNDNDDSSVKPKSDNAPN